MSTDATDALWAEVGDTVTSRNVPHTTLNLNTGYKTLRGQRSHVVSVGDPSESDALLTIH